MRSTAAVDSVNQAGIIAYFVVRPAVIDPLAPTGINPNATTLEEMIATMYFLRLNLYEKRNKVLPGKYRLVLERIR